MPVKIRLARRGTKKRPYYHIVVAEAEAPRDGRFIEKIGHINPLLPKDNPERQHIDEERAKHWLKSGASRRTASCACSTRPASRSGIRARIQRRLCRARSAPSAKPRPPKPRRKPPPKPPRPSPRREACARHHVNHRGSAPWPKYRRTASTRRFLAGAP